MKSQQQPTILRLAKAMALLLGLALIFNVPTLLAQRDDPENIPPPEIVSLAGTFQTQLGCPGNWNTDCEATSMTYDAEDDLWTTTLELEAGSYEYKAPLNGTWADNYGLNAEYYGENIPLEVAEAGPVTFWYDHKTRWVSDSINSLIANVSGDFQDEIGCPGDWQPDCLRSLLEDPEGDGIYQFVTGSIPAGDYEAKVAVNQSWDENYGDGGVADGPNIPFSVPENVAVIFTWDPNTGLLEITTGDASLAEGMISGAPSSMAGGGGMPAPAVSTPPDLVVVPGTIQSVLGCDGDWDPTCEVTALTYDEAFQLWSATLDVPAGDYEYKVALNGSWDVNFGQFAEPGGANIPLSLAENTAVSFYFSEQTGWITDSANSIIANVSGDFQDELGCAEDWQPACLRTWLQDPDGDGAYIFMTDAIPAGDYEAKVAVDQSWTENYGEGGAQDGANIPFSVPEDGTLVQFVWDSASKVLNIGVGEGAGPVGNLKELSAHWVTADTIAWNVDTETAESYALYYSPTGTPLSLGSDGIEGGEAIPLTLNPDGLSTDILQKFPHLENFAALQIGEDDLGKVRIALKGQVAVEARSAEGPTAAAGLQIPGVLDDLYNYDGPLGPTFEDGVPTLRVWAPTARSVKLQLFVSANPNGNFESIPMRPDPKTGVWSVTGEEDWYGRFYRYEVEVYTPATSSVVTNQVTDPYSVSLATNSTLSQIIDLTDPATMPEGWADLQKPGIAAPEDITIYELHIRDFSAYDQSVPAEHRGTYLAFTHPESNGMIHLAELANAGLTHLHLLPSFDIATINENRDEWVSPDPAELATFPPDSEEQQAQVESTADLDGFNWGYDPYHYNVPEGSYSTDPNGPTRIVEYRQMVQSLNDIGLYVVADVVYNHTNASGQSDRSVLDKIVPGYYHRLNATGRVETSTCCQNTATEHNMMRKLMVDSVVLWAKAYKIDGFRFDLMGHHMKDDMLAVRAALDALTLENDGVDGKSIYLYGEGWDFGEVASNARGVNATQVNMAGTGIGTFNDRLRDAVRGGSPFDAGQDLLRQGFASGLYTDPNAREEADPLGLLLQITDWVRIGLAGNLSDYQFVDSTGSLVSGAEIDYNGNPAGYTADPQENIVYISKHDNQTLYDNNAYRLPVDTSMADRIRMQNLGLSTVFLSQGVPFVQAGGDILRSKSLDRDSFNSGDWYNAIDWTFQDTNWGHGLPVASKNRENWDIMRPLLADPTLNPAEEDVALMAELFTELLQIRQSSPLFRLQTAVSVQDRLAFHNTGPEQIPGLIVMSLSDVVGEDLDANYDMVAVLFNANVEAVTFTNEAFAGLPWELHPIQQNSVDPIVQTASYDAETAAFNVPARTTAVFVLPQGSLVREAEPAPEPTAEPAAPEPTIAPVPTEEMTAPEPTAAPAATAQPPAAEPAEDGGTNAGAAAGAGVAIAAGVGVAIWAALRRRKQQG